MHSSKKSGFGHLFHITSMALNHSLNSKCKEYDLTLEQFRVLKQLYPEERLSNGELCKRVDKSPANVTRIVDRLVRKGFVDRVENSQDRRGIHIGLTKSGAKKADRTNTELEKHEVELTSVLSSLEISIIRKGLQKLYQNLND